MAHDVSVVNINDYPLPMYSLDIEAEIGIPEEAFAFSKLIDDNIVVDFYGRK
jgi:hypothetical protein